MSGLELKFSDSGTLVSPNIHDGYLAGLIALQGRALIVVRTVPGNVIGICLDGIKRMRADDFREGNIILDLEVILESISSQVFCNGCMVLVSKEGPF